LSLIKAAVGRLFPCQFMLTTIRCGQNTNRKKADYYPN